jgi:nitrile hydratase subunit beta
MEPRVHDRGGWPETGPLERAEHAYTLWEKRTDAIRGILGGKQLIRTDELRRAVESLDPGQYEQLSYYERWITAIEILLVEKGILTREEIDRKMTEWATCPSG